MKTCLLITTFLAFTLTAGIAIAAETKEGEATKIEWLTSLDQAVEQAKAQNKPILLDFFNPR